MFANSFSVLAAIPSKTVSGSNAVYGDPFSDRLNTYSSVGTVSNTVSGSRINVWYLDSEGKSSSSGFITPSFKDGRFSFSYSAPPNCVINGVDFLLQYKSGSPQLNFNYLPSPVGSYDISMDFTSDFSLFYDSIDIFSVYQPANASYITVNFALDGVKTSSGDFYVPPQPINIRGSYDNFRVKCYIPVSNNMRHFGGSYAIRFVSSPTPGHDTAGPNVSTEDIQAGIADGIGDINSGIGQLNQTMEYVSQSQDLIIKGIDNIILHISDQLYAFWDQLYNLIHVPTMAKLDQILAAIQRMANNSDIHAVVEQIKESTDKQTGEIIANDNANTQKVEQAVEKHGNFIIEGLKSLFIPSDTFFKTWFDEQYQFFHDRLGFLMLPIDILIQFVGIFQAATTGTPGIPFPEFKWIDGTVIIPAQTVGFDFLSTDWGKDIQSKLYFVGNVIMIGALLSLIHKKLEEVLRG